MVYTLEIKASTTEGSSNYADGKIGSSQLIDALMNQAGCYLVCELNGKEYALPIPRIPRSKRTVDLDLETSRMRAMFAQPAAFYGFDTSKKADTGHIRFRRVSGILARVGVLEVEDTDKQFDSIIQGLSKI
jgi:hypothetical protein